MAKRIAEKIQDNACIKLDELNKRIDCSIVSLNYKDKDLKMFSLKTFNNIKEDSIIHSLHPNWNKDKAINFLEKEFDRVEQYIMQKEQIHYLFKCEYIREYLTEINKNLRWYNKRVSMLLERLKE